MGADEIDKFKIGDIIQYGFFTNITIYKIDKQYYYLKDKYGNIRLVFKWIINKHAKLMKEEQ